MQPAYPFAAIVGQDDLKLALLLAAIEPRLGGVLIIGDRGTGKSTAVRGLADLLPTIRVVPSCPYNAEPGSGAGGCVPGCPGSHAESEEPVADVRVPVVELPLGATEDRVVGSLDLERALARGEKHFEPGLLARANRGFLYIDEVNLLEDHLVDLLLDVAASGENVVEREGISITHPSRFVLAGSGNPEEGELRPQLLDRFGLMVSVGTPQDVDSRVEVVRRRDAYERDPRRFAAHWQGETDRLRHRVTAARARLETVDVPTETLEACARLCMTLGTDGLRGELTLVRAARALAALEGSHAAGSREVERVATMALCHRLRRDPLDEAGSSVRVARALEASLESRGAPIRQAG